MLPKDDVTPTVFPFVSWRQLDVRLIDCLKEGAVEVGSVMKGTHLYSAKKGSGGITSSSDAIGTNLFHSYSLLMWEEG